MPRSAAVEVLLAVETRDAFSNIALDAAIQKRRLQPRDAALATAIAYGVLKRRSQLDRALGKYLTKPIRKLEPFTRAVLRSGCFQLLHLEKVPARAVVSEAVKLVKTRARHRAGLVNAILRRVADNTEDLQSEFNGPIKTTEAISENLGIGLWAAEQLVERLGFDEAVEYARAIQEPPPLTLRVRPSTNRQSVAESLTQGGVEAQLTRFSPVGIRLRRSGRATNLEPVVRGEAVVQDEASQLVSLFAQPKPDATVIDLCAGRGGKTFHLADLCPQGRVIASDISTKKLHLLERSATALGLRNVEVCPFGDKARLKPADVVLIDAPCSGSGVMRRHPEIRWKLDPERIFELCRTQAHLLDEAVALIKPGGSLVFAVCSDLYMEGGRNAVAFLERHPDFVRVKPEPQSWQEVLTSSGELLTQPHRHGTDGFFAAVFRRMT